jgi:hypothetical protein
MSRCMWITSGRILTWGAVTGLKLRDNLVHQKGSKRISNLAFQCAIPINPNLSLFRVFSIDHVRDLRWFHSITAALAFVEPICHEFPIQLRMLAVELGQKARNSIWVPRWRRFRRVRLGALQERFFPLLSHTIIAQPHTIAGLRASRSGCCNSALSLKVINTPATTSMAVNYFDCAHAHAL